VRILHTSDWHLGRSFHREGMLPAQAGFVDHLLEVVDRERVDLVVVSGDIYDRALPQVDAVALADETFARLAASRARVVLTSGNHDSARRLGFGSRLMDAAGLHVRTDPAEVGRPVVLDDEHGPVAVHGLPFLDPRLLREPWGLTARSHEAALTEAMRRVRADLAQRPSHTRSVVMAHAFVAGCAPSDSERDISVGGVSMVSASVFDGIHYTALGHLHGPHELSPSVRYSGSPLAYSFSEAGQRKGSWLVDLGADGVDGADFVEAPVPRPLAVLRGTLAELLRDPSHADHEGAWVQATLTDPLRPAGAMARLRERFPHALALAFEPSGRPLPSFSPEARATGRSDHDVVLDFVADLRGVDADAAESAMLREAVDACCHDPEADTVLRAGDAS
jgi:exonuclease SbcD